MIHFDVTKSAPAGHRSGLTRVSARLLAELGPAAAPVKWPAAVPAGDWWLTAELFAEEERPGLTQFLRTRGIHKAAIFHDAIPLKLPHLTWPRSVARHPGYLKLLAEFDRVWAVSAASRDELLGYWRWLGLERTPPVEVLPLGADFDGAARASGPATAGATPRQLLSVGILEPRKNQSLLLDACTDLWTEGLDFELHLVGRVNPHFGPPILARIRELRRRFPGLRYHAAATDAEVAGLYAAAWATVFPTLAEGCGLPLLESLWRGVPCVCSDLPVLGENAAGGGCLRVAAGDRVAWREALRSVLKDDALRSRLAGEARSRPLPTWAGAAQVVRAALG